MTDVLKFDEGQEAAFSAGTRTAWRDYAGIGASILCAIHCAAMPLIVGFLPAMGLSIMAHPSFHQWMAGICSLIAITAFVPGWRLHRHSLPIVVAGIGLIIVTAAAVFAGSDDCCAVCDESAEAIVSTGSLPGQANTCVDHCCATQEVGNGSTDTDQTTLYASLLGNSAAWWTPLGGMMLIAGHLLNRHFACRCQCCLPS